MFYGDLLQNNASNSQVQRRNEGRNAFYKYIHDSLAANKPFNKDGCRVDFGGRELTDFDQANGQLNYLIGSLVTGGPSQDTSSILKPRW